ncbi:MAG: hypothetical protein KDD94_02280, partial [Calditrichaeota bacterium]|nr:hypothetical protein [Calditrichota bacterium]
DSVGKQTESDSTFYLFVDTFSFISSSKHSFNKRLISGLRFQFRNAFSDEVVYFNNFRIATDYYNRVTLIDIERHVDRIIFAIFDSSPFKKWKIE